MIILLFICLSKNQIKLSILSKKKNEKNWSASKNQYRNTTRHNKSTRSGINILKQKILPAERTARTVPCTCVQFRAPPHKTDSLPCLLQLATVSAPSVDVSPTSVIYDLHTGIYIHNKLTATAVKQGKDSEVKSHFRRLLLTKPISFTV